MDLRGWFRLQVVQIGSIFATSQAIRIPLLVERACPPCLHSMLSQATGYLGWHPLRSTTHASVTEKIHLTAGNRVCQEPFSTIRVKLDKKHTTNTTGLITFSGQSTGTCPEATCETDPRLDRQVGQDLDSLCDFDCPSHSEWQAALQQIQFEWLFTQFMRAGAGEQRWL